jgi:hypothetical protein
MKVASRFVSTSALPIGLAAVLALSAVPATQVFAQNGPKAPHSAHKHNHINAHQLLGSLLHVDGVHQLGGVAGGALGAVTGSGVAAIVKNGKVADMTSGGKELTKVKSKQKMADAEGGFIKADYKVAQYDSGYESYGYCEDDGYQETCYWYEPSDVDQSGSYQDYSTYESSY